MGRYGAIDLYVTYLGQGGHQIDLYAGAAAVPTPTAWAGGLLLLGMTGVMNAIRRSRSARPAR